MANSSEPLTVSETEEKILEPVHSPIDQDYVNQWLCQTVEEAVSQGYKLRETKPQAHLRVDNCANLKIGLLTKPCPDKKRRQNGKFLRTAKDYNQYNSRQTNPCACNLVPQTTGVQSPKSQITTGLATPVSLKNYIQPNLLPGRTKPRKCPLRIAELAAPSKRRCLETWRAKYDTLPGFMVQRLKEFVMDERPIAHIPDAINCFKIKRKRSGIRRNCKKHGGSSTRMVCRLSEEQLMEIRGLCAVFGHSIAKLLIRPLNLTLNPDLQRLSQIISKEITGIMKNKRMNNADDSVFESGTIMQEISNKIAVWIAGVLDSTAEKLLEEDLKAKKLNEMRLGVEGRLVTVIEKQAQLQDKSAAELEEEEGPVLDFLDIVVDNVMSICEPTSSSDYDLFNNLTDIMNKATEELPTQLSNSTSSTGDGDTMKMHITAKLSDIDIREHVKNELDKVVDNVTVDETTDEPQNYEGSDITYSVDATDNTEAKTNSEGDEVKNSFVDNIVQNEEDNTKHDQANKDVGEVHHNEDVVDLDEKKSVKFSHIELGGKFRPINDDSDQTADTWRISTEHHYIKHQNLVFAPPNDHLLSEADESWPEDVITPMLKLSESVSKSVTSLGRIMEFEETGVDPDENGEADISEQSVTVIDPDSKTPIGNEIQPDQTVKDGDWLTHELEVISESQGDDDQTQEVLKGRGDYKDVDEKSVIPETAQQKRDSPQTKFDYKVNPKSAPSWVYISSQDCGCNKLKIPEKIKDCEIRKWCKNLEHDLLTLDQWSNWISSTCKSIIYLKQREEINKKHAPQKTQENMLAWLKLKKSIDYDATIWARLGQRRTRERSPPSPKRIIGHKLPTASTSTSESAEGSLSILESNDDRSIYHKFDPPVYRKYGKYGLSVYNKCGDPPIYQNCDPTVQPQHNQAIYHQRHQPVYQKYKESVVTQCDKRVYENKQCDQRVFKQCDQSVFKYGSVSPAFKQHRPPVFQQCNKSVFQECNPQYEKSLIDKQDPSLYENFDQTLYQRLDEIDRIDSWIHRMIVSTEYCVRCECKNYSKRRPAS